MLTVILVCTLKVFKLQMAAELPAIEVPTVVKLQLTTPEQPT